MCIRLSGQRVSEPTTNEMYEDSHLNSTCFKEHIFEPYLNGLGGGLADAKAKHGRNHKPNREGGGESEESQ